MIDITHSDYPKYKKEYEEIWREKEKELSKLKVPLKKGRDGLGNLINKNYYGQIIKLQKKYNYIFKESGL